MFKLAPLAVGLALLFGGCAQAKPPVWIISDADSTIVMFGSVHLLPEDADWQPDALKTALAKADDVWFEVPVDAASQLAASQAATLHGMNPAGQTLTGKMSAADVARLRRVAAKLNVNVAALEALRPWFADVALSQAFLAAEGAKLDSGVEQVLSRQVPAAAARRNFETSEQQVAILAGQPEREQLAALSETLRSIEEEPGAFDDIVDYWVRGDMTGLKEEALDEVREKTPDLYERLIVRRNTAWVPTIMDRLAGSGETVIVVGVGHLIGPDSVPALLRARGVKVEGP